MDREWKIEVKLTVEDIFFFLLRHSFSTRQGKLTWGLGVVALVGAPIVAAVWKDAFTALIFLMVALIYLVVSPLSLYTNAKRQMISNSVFKNKIIFTLNSEMLQIKQYTGEAKLFWHQLAAIDLTGRSYLLYVNNKQAFILPKRFVAAEDVAGLERLLKEKQKEDLNRRTESAGAAGENEKQAEKNARNEKSVPKEPTKNWKLPDIKEILAQADQDTGEEAASAAAEETSKGKAAAPESTGENGRPTGAKKKSESKKKNANDRNKNK